MNIEELITNACLVEAYDTVRDGSFRLATPFRYPDGSHIDIFLKDSGTLFDGFEPFPNNVTEGLCHRWGACERNRHTVSPQVNKKAN